MTHELRQGLNCNFNQILSLQRCFCAELVQMTYFRKINLNVDGHVALLETSLLRVQFYFDLKVIQSNLQLWG